MKYFKILGILLIFSAVLMISGANAGVLGLLSIEIPAFKGIYTSDYTTKVNSNNQLLITVGSVDTTWGTVRDVEARIKWGTAGDNTAWKAAPANNKAIYWDEPDTKVVGWHYSVQLRAKTSTITKITYNGTYNSN